MFQPENAWLSKSWLARVALPSVTVGAPAIVGGALAVVCRQARAHSASSADAQSRTPIRPENPSCKCMTRESLERKCRRRYPSERQGVGVEVRQLKVRGE